MVKQLLFLLLAVIPISVNAQPPGMKPGKHHENKPYRYFPKLGTAATFAPGLMSGQEGVNYYLNGHTFVFI
ncbi:MAG: hypothetical protein ACRC3B_02335, partial [Bacteroidia bacterium]